MKASDGAGIDLIGADKPDNETLGSDESDTAFLSSDESDESANTSDGEEKLHQDIRLILQENSGNVSKKWGNSEQWVLELRDGRRVAVLIQISLPPGEVTEVLEEQTQLALVPLSVQMLWRCHQPKLMRMKYLWRIGSQTLQSLLSYLM